MGHDHREGRRGEAAAVRHLRRRGWTILAARHRAAGGELDLVAARGGVVAICEVKARGDRAALVEPVTAAQRERIRRAAEAYVAVRPELAGRTAAAATSCGAPGRFRARVRHLPGAVGGAVTRPAPPLRTRADRPPN